MPVQINEVIVRAVVDSSASAGTTAAATTPAGTHTSEAELAAMVLEIIKEKKER